MPSNIHCYIDESGHTGANLFDPVQPIFYTGAVISCFDFDARYPTLLEDISRPHGLPRFHANELGLKKLQPHLSKIQSIIKRENIRFYLARVVKRDLALAKFFDTFFDPHENRSVPWHVYWILPMRFMLILKLDVIVSDEARQRFWAALMEPVEAIANRLLMESINLVRPQVGRLPDARSRELIGNALDWAEANSEAITYHQKSKRHRLPHYPNLITFSEMLGAFQRQSEFHSRPVEVIKHDRQMEIQPVLSEWHRLISNAHDGEVAIFGKRMKVRAVPNSSFVISSSAESAGIQLVDLILWLERKRLEQGILVPEANALLDRVERQAEFFDLSRQFTESKCREDLKEVYAAPWGEAEAARGMEFLDVAENRRLAAMKEYAERKTARL
ncbi:MAG: DUF3800 domain-containing protein [Cephaloticoccus sp.]|nr:DUF3800 domain-containing protein [Cephaloticoccus sp.]